MRTRTPRRVSAAAVQLGENVRTWRKLSNLTMAELAERAGISTPALHRIESGNPGVAFENVARVLLILDRLDATISATDPYETDVGRAQASHALPHRVRRSGP